MKPDNARAPGSCLRLARLLMGRNELRRSSDRLEGTLLAIALACFVVAVTVGCLFGLHVYRSQRAAAAELSPVMAVLSQKGPTYSDPGFGQAAARWRDARGLERSGMLTSLTAPGIWNATAGQRVRVWVTGSGVPAAPPSEGTSICTAALWGCSIPAGAALVLLACYAMCRHLLDRRRLESWGTAWASTGPRWTSLR
jgi:hypothetical protein